MQATDPSALMPASAPTDGVRAAFRDLHARRLHGFALLLVVGDRASAAPLASEAMNEGFLRLEELRHPERAAAWLRARVVRRLDRSHRAAGAGRDGIAALAELGVDAAVLAGLAALDHLERAALVAASIERLDRRDVATVVGRDGQRLDRLLTRARLRYARTVAAAPEVEHPDGPLLQRVHAVARRAMT